MRRGRLGQPSEERSSQPATQRSLAAAVSDQTRDLAELCRLLPSPVDLVLAEGFSEAQFPVHEVEARVRIVATEGDQAITVGACSLHPGRSGDVPCEGRRIVTAEESVP